MRPSYLLANTYKALFTNACLIILCLCAITSCAVLKKSNKTNKRSSIESIIEQQQRALKEIVTLNAKLKVDYVHEKTKQQFNAKLRYKKDGIIWMSMMPPLGVNIEVARISLTPDSIYFLNRMDKTAFIKPISSLTDYTGMVITFNQLATILLGKALLPNPKQIIEEIDQGFLIKSANEQILVTNTFNIAQELNVIGIKSLINNDVLSIEQKKHVTLNEDFNFSHNRYHSVTGSKNLTMAVDWNQVEINKTLKFPFKISKKYERLDK